MTVLLLRYCSRECLTADDLHNDECGKPFYVSEPEAVIVAARILRKHSKWSPTPYVIPRVLLLIFGQLFVASRLHRDELYEHIRALVTHEKDYPEGQRELLRER